MAPFKVHTVKFYDPEPLAIHSMAISNSSTIKTTEMVVLEQTEYPDINWVNMFMGHYNRNFISENMDCEIEIRGKSVDGRVYLGCEEPLHVYITSTVPARAKKTVSIVKKMISTAIKQNSTVTCDMVKFDSEDLNDKDDKTRLALSRSDNSIEIWDVEHTPVFLKFIPPIPEVQIESVGWFEDRLFACGLHGYLYEIDYHQLDIKEKLAVTSGPAWCLSICKPTKQIAVGTEEGYINIFNILKDSLEFHRLLDKQEGRILCIAWHPLGTYLATGSIDTIRVWTPTSGHPVTRMNTGRKNIDKETIVWAIEMTDDLTVITGDSNGRTSFWNGETGTLVSSIQSHKADVLALGVDLADNYPTVYSTGVDPTTLHFKMIRQQHEKKWVKSVTIRVGNNDVRCLAALPVKNKKQFCCGGVDSYLTVKEHCHIGGTETKEEKAGKLKSFRYCLRIPPLPRDGVIELAGDTSLFLFRYRTSLDVWRLGDTDDKDVKLERHLQLSQQPTRILRLDTPNEEKLVCSTINKSGTLIAYSTKKRFRVFALVWNEESSEAPCSIKKLKLVDTSAKPPHCMRFYQNDGNEYLLCGYGTPRVESFSVCVSAGVASSWHLQGDSLDTPQQLNLTSSIQHIQISGSTAVVSDFDNQVVALDLKKVAVISKMPKMSSASISSLTISPNEKNCVMAYSDNIISQVDIETSRFTSFYTALNENTSIMWGKRKCSISGLNYIKDDLLLAYDLRNLILIDEEKHVLEPAEKMRRYPKIYDMHGRRTGSEVEKTIIHPYPDLVAAVPINSNAIVCVELSSEQMDEKLPTSIVKWKHGAGF